MCKRRIVLMPKFRRKVIYSQGRRDMGEMLRMFCEYMGTKMIEGLPMPDHVHMLVVIPPRLC